MKTLSLMHLILISLWGGILLVEFVIESVSNDESSTRWAASAHYWTDLLFEIPIVSGVLITGFLLSWQHWPLSRLHWIKIGSALIGILFNLDCCRRVLLRFKYRKDLIKLQSYNRSIRFSIIGVPFGLIAAYIGLNYFV